MKRGLTGGGGVLVGRREAQTLNAVERRRGTERERERDGGAPY